MPAAGRRRTPGLRREEVAVLAGVGVSWYTRLEQGRADNVSHGVLDAVARTLRMSPAEREHLYLRAGLNPPLASAPDGAAVPDELRRVLDAWAPRPAYIRDRYWNLVAVNTPAEQVLGHDEGPQNCLVSFFTGIRFRKLMPRWEEVAPNVVARFRGDAGRYPEDPGFEAIADGLKQISPDFARLWARYEVADGFRAVKTVVHPEVGRLDFESTLLGVPELPGHSLVLYTPQPATGTAESLERLRMSTAYARTG